ncbi:MAG: molybdenum cofactor guanylyltransferase [Anaerolineae bacterium]
MEKVPAISGIVLAGGESRRMGTDKALLKLGGYTLIENVIARVSRVSQEVIVVANALENYRNLGVKLVRDVFPGKGSLGGIYSGLLAANHFHSLVVACDMPFLNLDLLRYMIVLAPNYDVVIPCLDRGYKEALHAIYSKNCLVPIENQLRRNHLKIIDFLDHVSVYYVEQEEIDLFDPQHLSFFNINTPADMERAKDVMKGADFDEGG